VTARALADPRNQAGQHRHAGQHDTLGHQVRGRQIEKPAGPHGAGEDLGVKPTGQAERLAAVKGAKAKVGHHMYLVVVQGVRPGILVAPGIGRQMKWLGQGVYHHDWHLRGNGQKRAQESQRTQLHGAPEPGVGTALVGQKTQVLGLR
jgi:hypothetical protein